MCLHVFAMACLIFLLEQCCFCHHMTSLLNLSPGSRGESFLSKVPHVVSRALRSAWGSCVHFASTKVFTTSEPLSPWKIPNPVLRISPLRLRPAQEVLCNFPDKLEAKFAPTKRIEILLKKCLATWV